MEIDLSINTSINSYSEAIHMHILAVVNLTGAKFVSRIQQHNQSINETNETKLK